MGLQRNTALFTLLMKITKNMQQILVRLKSEEKAQERLYLYFSSKFRFSQLSYPKSTENITVFNCIHRN
jgi:hypothetical protein